MDVIFDHFFITGLKAALELHIHIPLGVVFNEGTFH